MHSENTDHIDHIGIGNYQTSATALFLQKIINMKKVNPDI